MLASGPGHSPALALPWNPSPVGQGVFMTRCCWMGPGESPHIVGKTTGSQQRQQLEGGVEAGTSRPLVLWEGPP